MLSCHRRLFTIGLRLLIPLAVLAIQVPAATPALAATLTVNTASGTVNPADPCPVPASSAVYKTIQKAVACATAGDTITVSVNTYAEQVTVNKSLNLRGNRAGVDARSRLANAETVVTGVGNSGFTPFNITANDVTIDGFTVEGATDPGVFGSGIVVGAGTSGTQILNNIVQSNITGVSLANNSATPTTIRQNLFQNNNQPGPGSGTAIYSDQFQSGGLLTNVVVDRNTFTNHGNAAVLIAPTSGPGASNLTITNNTMSQNGNAILLLNTSNATITGNTMSQSTGSQMVIGGGNSGITIRSNAIVNGQTIGIRVGDFGGGSANTTTTVSLNRIKGHPTAGLQIESAANSYTGTLAAENNFWGCNTGPGTAGCDSVIPGSGTVDFNPWLQLTISAIPASFVNTNVAVNAYLTRNSDGADTSAAGTIPNGTPLTFATTCGTISPVPAPGQLSGGTARGLMRAPASPCTATVSATVDNATASAQVMIQAR